MAPEVAQAERRALAAAISRPLDFAGLYCDHCGALLSYLRKLGADDETAADCVQDEFVNLIERSHDVPGKDEAYMRRVARNAFFTELRHRRRRACSERAAAREAEVAPPERSQVDGGIWRAMLGLSGDLRRLVIWHICRGMSLRDCRQALGWGCSISTCKYRLDKALRELARRLRKNK